MKRRDSSLDIGAAGSSSSSSRYVDRHQHGRDIEEREKRRREWMRQQAKEREHERLKRQKIEEYERKRRAQVEESRRDRPSGHAGRSSYRSHDRSKSLSPNGRTRDKAAAESDNTKAPIMSQKYESTENNERLFKGPEGSKIDMAELRRIKVDIHRKINAPLDAGNELRRGIVDPEEVKLKRREGEGSKPIFEREELKKSAALPAGEVEEHRTVVAIDDDKHHDDDDDDDDDKEDARRQTAKKRAASPTCPSHRPSSRRHTDNRDARCASDRRRDSDGLADRGSRKHERDTRRNGSTECRVKKRADDAHGRHSSGRSSRESSRDRAARRSHRSHSGGERESRRSDERSRSRREHRGREDSRDERRYDGGSREGGGSRVMQVPQHYPEAIPVPTMYYEGYHPRAMIGGPMIPMRPMMGPMGPMRPPYPPRFFPPGIFRPVMHPADPRFARMY